MKPGRLVKPSHLLAAALALGAIVSAFTGLIPSWTPALATAVAFNALGLLGLNLIFGVVGMLAFGQSAFMALPAYGAGMLDAMGVPFALAVVAGLVGALAIAWAMARIFVRLPGIYLAVGTLGFGYVVEGLARAFPATTGGASGLVLARGRQLSVESWYAIAIAALVGGLAAYAWYVRGAVWRRLRTICHDELAAAVVGIDVVRVKARIFTIGSAFAIVAGILHAYYVGLIVPEDGGIDSSLEQVGMVMVGGLGFLLGPVIGTTLIQWLFMVTGYAARYELLIYGAAFLVAVIYARDGITGWLVPPWRRLCRRIDGAPPPPAPVAVGGDKADPAPRDGICLSVAAVSKRFGGVQALEDVSFEVAFGEIFAIVGPNGAGKSTLFNIISAIEMPSSGTLRLAGDDLAPLAIHDRAPFIGRSFQVARLVPDLDALANVMVRLDQIAPRMAEAERAAVALSQLEAFGLGGLARRPVRELSLGQHKLIDLTRAAVGDPPLVLLDEPAVGLTESELAHLGDLLEQLRARGSAVVIVEHNIDFVAGIAGRGIVLDSGRTIALGPIRDVLADPRVHEAYFGALT